MESWRRKNIVDNKLKSYLINAVSFAMKIGMKFLIAIEYLKAKKAEHTIQAILLLFVRYVIV